MKKDPWDQAPPLGLPITYDWKWYVQTIRLYAALLEARLGFAEASYGDGEFFCMMGGRDGKTTARGQTYGPELRRALIKTLRHPVGQWCCYWGEVNPETMRPHKPVRDDCDQWLEAQAFDEAIWLSRRSLPAASCHGDLWPVFRALRRRHVILVGPPHFQDLRSEDVFHDQPPVFHVHPTDAWKQVEEVREFVLSEVEKVVDPVILISAGMGAPLMVHDLWPILHPHEPSAVVWDIGAVLDPYCGVFSRRVYKTEAWQKNIMELNLR